jgi:hypothetical protein
MVTSRETLEKIRRIIEKHYSMMTVSVLGSQVFTKDELKRMQDVGIDTSNRESLLSAIYYHNYINNPISKHSPKNLKEMRAQQSTEKPNTAETRYSVQSVNDRTKQFIDKLAVDTTTRIENIVRANNDAYKFDTINNPGRTSIAEELIKESSLGKVKQLLRDTSKDGNRDWQRVALTEMSNAIGIGSVDRIASDNKGMALEEVFVYRVIVGDAITCKFCRKFYGDVGDAPKVYRLSTLLANGSNYSLPQAAWKPVAGATHPNTRTSQVIELKPGFQVLPGGSVTYIGLAKWIPYVKDVVVD